MSKRLVVKADGLKLDEGGEVRVDTNRILELDASLDRDARELKAGEAKLIATVVLKATTPFAS